MKYIVIYADKKGRLHKRSAKSLAHASYMKKQIIRGLADAHFEETVEGLKVRFSIEIKSEKDLDIVLRDLEDTFNNCVHIFREDEWNEMMEGMQLVNVPELGQFVITNDNVDFSDPEEYQNLINFLKEDERENV